MQISTFAASMLAVLILSLPSPALADFDNSRGSVYTPYFSSCTRAVEAADMLIAQKRHYDSELTGLSHRVRQLVETRIFELKCTSRGWGGEKVNLSMISVGIENLQAISRTVSALGVFRVPVDKTLKEALNVLVSIYKHPSASFTCDQAYQLYTSWKQSREALVNTLYRWRDETYCYQVLTRDLTLNAIHDRALGRSCGANNVTGIQYEMRLTGRSPGNVQFWETPRLPGAVSYCSNAGFYNIAPVKVGDPTPSIHLPPTGSHREQSVPGQGNRRGGESACDICRSGRGTSFWCQLCCHQNSCP